jgi:hypothetical protein
MARKTATITIQTEGRDKGKTFKITEMSAVQAERWAIRALTAMVRNGVPIPDDALSAGVQGVLSAGLLSLIALPSDEIEQLMREMMACVEFVPDPRRPDIAPRALIEDGIGPDIEEVATRLRLKSEVIKLHTGFSIADAIWNSQASADQAVESSGPNMPMSPEP